MSSSPSGSSTGCAPYCEPAVVLSLVRHFSSLCLCRIPTTLCALAGSSVTPYTMFVYRRRPLCIFPRCCLVCLCLPLPPFH